jgi:hypothetical protein
MAVGQRPERANSGRSRGMDKPHTTNLSKQEVEETVERMFATVEEVIKKAFYRMPFDQDVVLSNGRKGQFKAFVEPQMDEDGQWHFGIDFEFDHDGKP